MGPAFGALLRLILRAVALIAPTAYQHWVAAMRAEVEQIHSTRHALRFAIGCLFAAIQIRFSFWGTAFRLPVSASAPAIQFMLPSIIAGLIAVTVGLAYPTMVGAPLRMVVINAGAAVIGLLFLFTLRAPLNRSQSASDAVALVASLVVLLTALFGTSVDGATRWLVIGPLTLQPSLIMVPLAVMLFARAQTNATTLAMLVLAVALATQPDRAMAAALLAPLSALVLVRSTPRRDVVCIASVIALLTTLHRPDTLPAVPYVDHVLWTTFNANTPLAVALWLACLVILISPWVSGARPQAELRYAFSACWLAIIGAAAVGAYPTPLVGYGGSAIVGYFACLLALEPRLDHRRNSQAEARENNAQHPLLRATVRLAAKTN